MQFEIETGKKYTKKKTGAPPKYPFGDLEIGQSFFVPNIKSAHSYAKNRSTVLGKTFKATTEKGGARFWRTS